MTALDVIRDIAEYSRPDALSRIRADAYRHPHDPANSGAYDDVVDEVKELIDQFRDEVDRELEDKAQAEVRRHI